MLTIFHDSILVDDSPLFVGVQLLHLFSEGGKRRDFLALGHPVFHQCPATAAD